MVYVGKWGDVKHPGSNVARYTKFVGKNRTQVVNLAIVRIKEEQDFIDNTLIKYIEVLHDLDLIEDGFYAQIKYGTDDERTICLVKNGLPYAVAEMEGNHHVRTYHFGLLLRLGSRTVHFLPHPQNPFQSHLQDAFCVGKDAVRAYVGPHEPVRTQPLDGRGRACVHLFSHERDHERSWLRSQQGNRPVCRIGEGRSYRAQEARHSFAPQSFLCFAISAILLRVWVIYLNKAYQTTMKLSI